MRKRGSESETDREPPRWRALREASFGANAGDHDVLSVGAKSTNNTAKDGISRADQAAGKDAFRALRPCSFSGSGVLGKSRLLVYRVVWESLEVYGAALLHIRALWGNTNIPSNGETDVGVWGLLAI